MTPIKSSPYWFKSLDSYNLDFFGKISLKTVQKTRDSGGLDLPNFHHYFLANRLQYISKWCKFCPLGEPWLDLEEAFCFKLNESPHHGECL